MNISFSTNTWKLNQIQNIDLKLEEQFYASTPYNLNDFKETSKSPNPLFKTIDSNLLQQKNSVKKQLIKMENSSLAIFLTYFYEFLYQLLDQIQKKSNYQQNKNNNLQNKNNIQTKSQKQQIKNNYLFTKNNKQEVKSNQIKNNNLQNKNNIRQYKNEEIKIKIIQPHMRNDKTSSQQQTDIQTDRKFNYLQKNFVTKQNQVKNDQNKLKNQQINEQKKQQLDVLKSIKMKIYQIDLCKLKNIPQRFVKYYNNNILKKIIFQYLSKCLYNISLLQILLQNNQVLCFALSLISQSLLLRKNKISLYNQNRSFYDQVYYFLIHFDHFDDSCFHSIPKTQTHLPSSLSTQSKLKQKPKSTQQFQKKQSFANFILTNHNQMKSKHSSLKQQGYDLNRKYFLFLLNTKKVNKKVTSPTKNNKKIPGKVQSPKKKPASSKSITIKSDKKLKIPQKNQSWMKYLGCLQYFFTNNQKKNTKK